MEFRRLLRAGVAIVVLLALACAPAMAKVVSPGSDFYYLDKAGVLSEALEGEIFFCNKLLYDACGAQIVVVTMDSTGHEAIDDYAYDLFNEWGIGDAAKDNGFLLLLAIGDEDYYARTGSGLESKFSASTIKQYYDQYLETDFAAQRYEAGVKKFFEAVFERIAVTYGADVTVQDGIAAYEDYVARNSASSDYGGYSGSRRNGAANYDYRSYDEDDDFGIGLGAILFILLIIFLIVIMSKGRRARRRAAIIPPPPPRPSGFGYRPTRTVYHDAPFGGGPRVSSGWSSRSSGSLFGGSSSSRSSFGSSSSSRSSFGGGSSRSSSSRSSSGFGGSRGGGGRTSGGGAGRGRH